MQLRGDQIRNMIHEMVEIEVEATNAFLWRLLRNLGKDVPVIDPCLEHILISGMFTGFLRWSFTICPEKKGQSS